MQQNKKNNIIQFPAINDTVVGSLADRASKLASVCPIGDMIIIPKSIIPANIDPLLFPNSELGKDLCVATVSSVDNCSISLMSPDTTSSFNVEIARLYRSLLDELSQYTIITSKGRSVSVVNAIK